MGDEIRFVRRQYGSEVAQFLELTEFLERGVIATNFNRERRAVPKYAEENELLFGRGKVNLATFQQHHTCGFDADQERVVPDGDKAAVVTGQRVGKPVCVFAQLAATIDKRAGKYILILFAHLDSVMPKSAAFLTRHDRAAWAGLIIECIRVLNVARSAGSAPRQVELVVVGNAVQQVPCPFETELCVTVQQQVGLIGTTKAVTKLHIRSGPAGSDIALAVDAQQQAVAVQRDQCRGL